MEHRALYPWENGLAEESEQPVGLERPLEDTKPASEDTQAPAAPAYVLAHVFEEDRVTLLWGETPSAEGYLILRGESPGSMKPIAAVEEPSYIDTQARPGKTYYYSARAYNDHGQSGSAPAVSAALPQAKEGVFPSQDSKEPTFAGKRLRLQKQGAFTGKDAEEEQADSLSEPEIAPFPPANLRAVPMGTKRIALHWDLGGADLIYRIYRSATPWCSYGLIAETEENRYTDSVPEVGTKYFYFVQAVRCGRAGEASVMAEAVGFPPLPAPEPPAHLRAASLGDAVELRWNHARGAAAYAVYGRVEAGEFRLLGHTLDNGFVHEAVPSDVVAEYRVQSYHDSGASEPCAPCGVRTGAPRAQRPRPAPGLNLNIPALRRFPVFSMPAGQNRG